MPDRFNAEQITYEVSDCWIGKVLIAQSSTGVCGILLGDSAAELVRNLNQRLPEALLRAGGTHAGHAATVAAAAAYICNPAEEAKLQLDLRGTAFQQKVWQHLRKIPFGSTLSYTEVAIAIGMPTAARAVASACAANPVAVVIPCHRVTAANGALGGYRWGTERKLLLLQAERATWYTSGPPETLSRPE